MKKVFATLTVLAMLTFGSAAVMAQEAAAPAEEAAVEQVDEAAPAAEEVAEAPAEEAGGLVALHKTLKTKFIEGGAGFMALTLVTLVFGLALCIERIIYLSLSKTNTKELLENIEKALKEGDTEEAEKLLKELRIKVYLCAKFLAANGEYDARIMQVISLVDKAIDEKDYTEFVEEARDVAGAVLLGLPYEPRELTEHS